MVRDESPFDALRKLKLEGKPVEVTEKNAATELIDKMLKGKLKSALDEKSEIKTKTKNRDLTKGIASVLQSDAYNKRKHLLKVQETSIDIPNN